MLRCEKCRDAWSSLADVCLRCAHPVPLDDGHRPLVSAWLNNPENDDEPDDDEDEGATLADVHAPRVRRLKTGERAIDLALKGGFASCGTYLLTGEPAAGKTTLALRAIVIAAGQVFSWEMPLPLLAILAAKQKLPPAGILASRPATLAIALSRAERARGLLVLDSLQEVPGCSSPEQALRAFLDVTQHARETGKLCLVAISQRNKEGGTSGSKALEHLADGVIDLAVDEVRIVKHRFGIVVTRPRA